MRVRALAATSSTARSKAALLALEGALNPLSFLTNCKDAARISASVAGGSKLKSVLMFLHMMRDFRNRSRHSLLLTSLCQGKYPLPWGFPELEHFRPTWNVGNRRTLIPTPDTAVCV